MNLKIDKRSFSAIGVVWGGGEVRSEVGGWLNLLTQHWWKMNHKAVEHFVAVLHVSSRVMKKLIANNGGKDCVIKRSQDIKAQHTHFIFSPSARLTFLCDFYASFYHFTRDLKQRKAIEGIEFLSIAQIVIRCKQRRGFSHKIFVPWDDKNRLMAIMAIMAMMCFREWCRQGESH